jgi:hypothetical protein
MTIREKFEQMLYERGLFPEQAKAVMDRAVEDAALAAMRGRWGDDVSGYSEQLIPALGVSVGRVALEWINENCPEAWFRSLFESEGVKV